MNSPELYWNIRINKKWTKRSFALLIVLFVFYFVTIPFVCDYTDRSKVAEILILLSADKAKIQEILEHTQPEAAPDFSTLDSVVKIGPYGNMKTVAGDSVFIEHYYVDFNGKITLLASGLNIFIQLAPVVDGGKVKAWHCYGRPLKLMPANCRTEKNT